MLCYIPVFYELLCWSICLSCVLRVCELFGGVIAILLLNVMSVFRVSGGALSDIPYMVFQRICVLCL